MTRILCTFLLASTLFYACKNSSRVTKNIAPLEYEYYKSKSKVQFKDSKGTNLSFTMNLRSKKDSIIWASVLAPLGIEVARIKITQDSAFIINKLEKEYSEFSVQELTAKVNYPIAFENLQNLLMGELIYPVSAKDKIKKDSSMHVLEQSINDILVKSFINPNLKRVSKIDGSKADQTLTFKVNYSEFSSIDQQVIPLSEEFYFKSISEKGTEETVIEIEFSKVEFPTEKLSFPFYVGDRYVKK